MAKLLKKEPNYLDSNTTHFMYAVNSRSEAVKLCRKHGVSLGKTNRHGLVVQKVMHPNYPDGYCGALHNSRGYLYLHIHSEK